MKDYAASAAFKKEIIIFRVLVFAEFLENNQRPKKKLNVSIVVAEDVRVEIDLFQ